MIERHYTVGAPDHRPPGMIPEGREWTERIYSQDELAELLGVPPSARLISMSRSWWSGEMTVTFEEAACEYEPSAGGSRSGPATA